MLGKSVTFVGLPPSTSPDSSPVSTQSIVSSELTQHFKIKMISAKCKCSYKTTFKYRFGIIGQIIFGSLVLKHPGKLDKMMLNVGSFDEVDLNE